MISGLWRAISFVSTIAFSTKTPVDTPRPSVSLLQSQAFVLGVEPHEMGNEGTERVDLEAAFAGVVERSLREARAEAASLVLVLDLGVRDRDPALARTVVGEPDQLVAAAQLVAAPLGSVLDVQLVHRARDCARPGARPKPLPARARRPRSCPSSASPPSRAAPFRGPDPRAAPAAASGRPARRGRNGPSTSRTGRARRPRRASPSSSRPRSGRRNRSRARTPR